MALKVWWTEEALEVRAFLPPPAKPQHTAHGTTMNTKTGKTVSTPVAPHVL
jgi:hypothetical protein